jgi:hypothetical protein
VSGNGDVRLRIAQLRDVQQGLLTLEEMQEADADARQPTDDFGEPLPVFAADDDDDWHVGGGGTEPARRAAGAALAVNLAAEQMERMARNRQLAIEKAAALMREAGRQGEGGQGEVGRVPAGGWAGADEFPEEEDGYSDDMGGFPDSNCDEQMAAQMLGDIEDEDDAPILRGTGALPPWPARVDPSADRVAGGAAAAQAETQAYGDLAESLVEASPGHADPLEGVGSSGLPPEDETAERRARALADAMALDDDF